jgi:NADH-quinone oxidoreductase subunit E
MEAPTARVQIDEIVLRYGKDRTQILAMLQDIQEIRNYLPKEWLQALAESLGMPFPKVIRVATFFKALSLEPRGKHICRVCVGTTCHVRGAAKLVDKIERDFAVKAGGTSQDMLLTLETVGCVGACALGPLVVMDGTYHGHMTTESLGKVLRGVKKEEPGKEN